MKEYPWFYALLRRPLAALIHLAARMDVYGLDHVPDQGPVILVANHLSMMDILAVSVPVSRRLHFMTKAELFRVPVVGGVFRLLGAFPVRRGEGDRESLRISQDILDAGQALFIFPEGHRSDNHAMIPGHTGVALIALRAGSPVPIVPIGVSGTERLFKFGRIGPFAPRIRVVYGEPFTLTSTGGRRTRDDLERGIDTIMRQIAALLPPQYRGVYAQPSAEPAAVVASADHAPLEHADGDPQWSDPTSDDEPDGGASL